MERSGSKRVLGLALIVSAGVMFVLAALFWSGVIKVVADAKPLLTAALVLAAVVDLGIGVRFLQSAEPESRE